ncbi:2993_t:CDS:2 [Dentiscutata erythropus]|uniref:2993_t:CDS:1 n=1 Tax=Dentiscutata erythropus TaxID=1348616 RepID=A0A9N9A3D4_9GLOM|nr:2993_t:CDS:2 [Dentiscutata erythropus]
MVFLVFLDHIRLWAGLLSLLVFLYVRNFHITYTIFGGGVVRIIVEILKRIIREPRPINCKRKKKSYGMPSSHSAIVIYFAIFFSLQLYTSSLYEFFDFISIHTIQITSPIKTFIKLILFSLISLTALSVVWSRVALGYHTKKQVIVGMALGFWLGIIWYRLWWGYWSKTWIGQEYHLF